MNSKLIIVGVGVIIVLCCMFNIGKEKYVPFINPTQAPTAPWIPHKTPIPIAATLSSSTATSLILAESVDPGAHMVCQKWCNQKGGKDKIPDFMTVCIDTCMQEKWTNPDSKLKMFKP